MKSMTGFGRAEIVLGGRKFRAEVASVNRKQTDIVVNLPRDLAELEPQVRALVGRAVSRGRINVYLACEVAGEQHGSLQVDHELAKQYRDALADLSKELGTELSLTGTDLLRAPGVLTVADTSIEVDAAWPAIEKVTRKAMTELIKMRRAEGKHLQDDLGTRLSALQAEVEAVKKLAPSVIDSHRANLKRRLADGGLEIDLADERILKEIGLFSDRSDISEETTRLASHFKQMAKYVKSKEPVGRAMDFLSQEMNRELNTIGSKANNATIAQHIVNAKTELEKMREQVQNVE
ncbi:MAG: hypothetical protein ACI8XO_000678 [Verrucomicrobiales bacterium]|jgi:uncharacterized protein (TIGR00255 family)